jgi:tetratricopeptide (TPR) repeat protein
MKGKQITEQADLIALIGGLTFVAHPIQTQAVTYIVQRLASLATLFYLASLTFYVKARLLHQAGGGRILTWSFFGCAFAAAGLGIFSKETVLTLPFTVMLYEIFFLRIQSKIPWKYLVVFLFAAIIIPLAIYTYKPDFVQLGRQKIPGGAIDITPINYLFTQFRVLVTYLRLLLLPVNQNLDYDYPVARGLFESDTLFSFIFLALILFTGLLLYRRFRLLSYCIFWFFITLLPESSIIPIRDVIFEHRLYLPMAGYSIFFASLLYYFAQKKYSGFITTILLISISFYSVLTYNRNSLWRDEVTLCSDTIKKSPLKARPYYLRAKGYLQSGEYKKAIADCNKALSIDFSNASAYNNRGIAYALLGEYARAISDFNTAIKFNPFLEKAYFNRGNCFRLKGDYKQAIADFSHALGLDPNDEDIFFNRSLAFMGRGEHDRAVSDLSQAINLNPHNAEFYYTRGYGYYMKGENDSAIADFNLALQIDKKYVESLNNRGLAFIRKGLYEQALADFTAAINIKPDYAEAYNNRALVFFSIKKYGRAWQDIKKAQKLGAKVNPDLLHLLKRTISRN